ncbi:hypothetical protein GQ55_2G288800 [Panicum hallii var. hallii]|uniref:Protein kinase domain-containing protein n=1 Tax=Panicum hallii var. hallii TaxID=1504633 RepID=A0A2T7ETH7_9POAL|nr:hypothetical protein GQ55_2G288800 [Panicum hallii var. hallii]
MKYPRLLLRLLLLSLPAVLVLAAADDLPAHLPGCPSTCGNVDIPYPFGIGDQCAIHSGFNITCAPVNGTERPYKGAFEVTKISVPDAKAWMKMGISWRCYGQTDTRNMREYSLWQNFTNTHFRFSQDDNKIFVIGCNTTGYMTTLSYVLGCYSTCSREPPTNGSCSGAGCCKVDLPKDQVYLRAFFNEYYNTSTGCSYIIVMEEKEFSYSTTYSYSTNFWNAYKGQVPVVMDWIIRRRTCEASKKNTSSYACVSNNSECVDASDTNGRAAYRCKCQDGYQGNPYIKGGCTDIDECLHQDTTDSCAHRGGTCLNTQGNFPCLCPQGKQMINDKCISNQKSSSWVMPVVGASVGLVVLVVTITCAYLIQERRKLQHIKQRYFQQHGGMLLFEEIKSHQGIAFKIFSEAELQEATDKFNERGVLGHGGHGTVYKGLLAGNVEVAVKRCMSIDEQHKKEFGKEMLILSQINHKNIVKLFGCCLEVEVPMLVYEFIPNGTLFQLIHGNHGRQISLATRMQIAHQSAEALAYLHSWASPPILHGDVKSSNILIDRDYTAKVSDFGASILAPTDESQFVTIVQGTCGYLDPEYMQTCQLTNKSDVYSFGVVLLELLTRKKPFNLDGPEHEKSLALRFISVTKEDKLEEILDDQIMNDENMEVLEEVAELAKQCLEMSGVNRPSMREVSKRLHRLRKEMQHPWAQQNPEEMQHPIHRRILHRPTI